ncbi:13190_t:CDS:1 [Entrophospora sp. SA101]|nr:13190_t:CDS:1 [Entrophospora sp. SA101]
MLFVNCAVEEAEPHCYTIEKSIESLIDTGANADLITQTFINELGLVHHVNESNGIELQTPSGSFSVLGKVELQTSFNVDGRHLSTDPVEFLVVGPDWHGPDLVLGKPWLQKNGATIDMCNNKLSIHDNFAIPIFQSG